MIARDLLINSLYHLHVDADVNLNKQIVSVVGQKRPRDEINQKYLCHHRLGHIGELYLACESFLRGKMAKLPFVGYGERATELLALIHTNVCGSFDVQVRGGYTYFIIFTDDLSRYVYVYLMKHKFEAFKRFKKFKNKVKK